MKELAEELKRGIAQEVKKAVTASLDEFEQNEKEGELPAKPKVQRPLVIRKAQPASEGKVKFLMFFPLGRLGGREIQSGQNLRGAG